MMTPLQPLFAAIAAGRPPRTRRLDASEAVDDFSALAAAARVALGRFGKEYRHQERSAWLTPPKSGVPLVGFQKLARRRIPRWSIRRARRVSRETGGVVEAVRGVGAEGCDRRARKTRHRQANRRRGPRVPRTLRRHAEAAHRRVVCQDMSRVSPRRARECSPHREKGAGRGTGVRERSGLFRLRHL